MTQSFRLETKGVTYFTSQHLYQDNIITYNFCNWSSRDDSEHKYPHNILFENWISCDDHNHDQDDHSLTFGYLQNNHTVHLGYDLLTLFSWRNNHQDLEIGCNCLKFLQFLNISAALCAKNCLISHVHREHRHRHACPFVCCVMVSLQSKLLYCRSTQLAINCWYKFTNII